MAHYIDKDALVAEIKKRIKYYQEKIKNGVLQGMQAECLKEFLYLQTLLMWYINKAYKAFKIYKPTN